MGKGSLVVFQSRKVGFFQFFKEFFFGGVGWDGWKKGVGIYISCYYYFRLFLL